jgi:hypothetical protein
MAEVANADSARKFRNSNRCVERLTLVHLNARFFGERPGRRGVEDAAI